MIRTPLRPLARILKARAQGQNPDAIEAENIRLRHEEDRDRARNRAEGKGAGGWAVCGSAPSEVCQPEPFLLRTAEHGSRFAPTAPRRRPAQAT